MGWGRFYEVSNNARLLFENCSTKAEWYEALGTLDPENIIQLDAEESIEFWRTQLQLIGHPAARFFYGDLRSKDDECDDPSVCFVSYESSKKFLTQLEDLGEQFFVDLFARVDIASAGEYWMYRPLLTFLQGVCARGHAVILIWEA